MFFYKHYYNIQHTENNVITQKCFWQSNTLHITDQIDTHSAYTFRTRQKADLIYSMYTYFLIWLSTCSLKSNEHAQKSSSLFVHACMHMHMSNNVEEVSLISMHACMGDAGCGWD